MKGLASTESQEISFLLNMDRQALRKVSSLRDHTQQKGQHQRSAMLSGGSLGRLPISEEAAGANDPEKVVSPPDKFQARMNMLQKSFKNVRRDSVTAGDIMQTLKSTTQYNSSKQPTARTPKQAAPESPEVEAASSFRGEERLGDRGPSSLSKQCRRLSMHIISQEEVAAAQQLNVDTPPPAKTNITQRMLEGLLEWIIAGQMVEERSSPTQQTRWTRWLSDAEGVMLFALTTWLFELVLIAAYAAFRVWVVVWVLAGHVALMGVLVGGMRVINGLNVLQAPQSMLWFRRVTMLLLVFVPGLIHFLLGGAGAGRAGDVLLLSFLAPVGMLLYTQDVQRESRRSRQRERELREADWSQHNSQHNSGEQSSGEEGARGNMTRTASHWTSYTGVSSMEGAAGVVRASSRHSASSPDNPETPLNAHENPETPLHTHDDPDLLSATIVLESTSSLPAGGTAGNLTRVGSVSEETSGSGTGQVSPMMRETAPEERPAKWCGAGGWVQLWSFDRRDAMLLLLVLLRGGVSVGVVLAELQRGLKEGEAPINSVPRALRNLSYVLYQLFCPLLLIAASRHAMLEFVRRRTSVLKSTQLLLTKQVRIEKMLHSLVPPFRANALRDSPPKTWYQFPPDYFNNCSVLQMDIAGFTDLSTNLFAEELIDVLNVAFSHIDQAAEYVGNIWKVETIGDCLIAVAGGPNPCADHAVRAVQLGFCILEIMERISEQLEGVTLQVRVAVHSGDICAAGVGSVLPRCLIFGKDVEVVRVLEAGGERGAILISEATAQQLPESVVVWRYSEERSVEMNNGDRISAKVLPLQNWNRRELKRLAKHNPPLNNFMNSLSSPGQDGVGPTRVASWNQRKQSRQSLQRGSEELEESNSNNPALASPTAAAGEKRRGIEEDLEVVSEGFEEIDRSQSSLSNVHSIAGTSDSAWVTATVGHPSPAARLSLRAKSASLRSLQPRDPTPSVDLLEAMPHRRSRSEFFPTIDPRRSPELRAVAMVSGGHLGQQIEEPERASSQPNGTGTPTGSRSRRSSVERPRSQRVSLERRVSATRLLVPPPPLTIPGPEEPGPSSLPAHLGSPQTPASAALSGSQHLEPAHSSAGGRRRSRRREDGEGRGRLWSWEGMSAPTSAGSKKSSLSAESERVGSGEGRGIRLGSVGFKADWQENVRRHSQALDRDELERQARRRSTASNLSVQSRRSSTRSALSTRSKRRSIGADDFEDPTREGLIGRAITDQRGEMVTSVAVAESTFIRKTSRSFEQELDVWFAHADKEWLKDPVPELEEAERSSAEDAAYRRSRVAEFITQLFLLASAVAGAVQCAVLLLVGSEKWPATHPKHTPETQMVLGIAPGVYAAVALVLVCVSRALPKVEGSAYRRWARRAAHIFLFLSPAVFVAGLDGPHSRSAGLWAFMPAVLRCNFNSKAREAWREPWLWWAGGYLAVIVALHSVMAALAWDLDAGELSGWQAVLVLLHQLAPTTLILLPFSITVKQRIDDERCDELVLKETMRKAYWEQDLLRALVPHNIAQRLRSGEAIIADRHDNATVVFIYMLDYEDLIYKHGIAEVLEWINEVFCCLDEITTKAGDKLFKVDTLHNFYMAVSGCPVDRPDHALQCVRWTIEMAKHATRIKRPDGHATLLKVGISSGPLSSGVVGVRSPRWSIFGDTVNTASRMGSMAETARPDWLYIHISPSTHHELKNDHKFLRNLADKGYELTARGSGMEIKGKGFLQTFHLRPSHRVPADAKPRHRHRNGADKHGERHSATRDDKPHGSRGEGKERSRDVAAAAKHSEPSANGENGNAAGSS